MPFLRAHSRPSLSRPWPGPRSDWRTRLFRFGLSASLAVSLAFLPARAQAQLQPLTAAPCPAATGAPEDPTYPLRQQAFAADAAGDHDTARHLMRCAIHANPKDLIALRQEVYLDLNAHDPASAAEDIDALRAQDASSAQLEAQEGYIFAGEHRIDDARLAFGRAIAFHDPAITAKSMRAIAVLDGEYPRHTLQLSADSQYLNRFSDGITDTWVRYFERLGRHSPLLAYANARLLRDTASNGGTLPQIFSDNAFLAGAGLAFNPHHTGLIVTAEANEAYVFYGSRTGTATLAPDLRAVVAYYGIWRGEPDGSFGDRFFSDRFFLEANGSFGFYSRYQHDAIAYLQPRVGVDLTREGWLRLTPFFQPSVALDTNRQFYNNTVELIPGLDAASRRIPSVALRGEFVRGYYLPGANASPNPYGPTYNDFRIRLIFQKNIALGLGEKARSR